MQNIPVALEAFCGHDPDENYFIWFWSLALRGGNCVTFVPSVVDRLGAFFEVSSLVLWSMIMKAICGKSDF